LYFLIGILITLSILMPFELGEKADPLQTPHAIKPEWYFLPMYQVLKYFPKLIGIFVLGLAPIFLIIWPFLDKTKERHPARRPISVAFGIFVVISLIVFGLLGHWAESKQNFFGKEYQFDAYGIPHRLSDKEEKIGPTTRP
ncbi:MAG: hypothetical protein AABY86_16055, partial [Bdellovibrionota bacterium]